MRPGLFVTAFVLLAGITILGTAGIAALDASYSESHDTANATGEAPPVLSLGESVGSTIASMVPWLALFAVPIGIAGLLGIYAFAPTASSSGGRR
jgi:hypothetical protein